MMNTNVFLSASFFIYVSFASMLGMQQIQNPFFNKKEAAFYALQDSRINRHIPEQHLVSILTELRHDVIMTNENNYVQFSVQLRTLNPIADFLNICWYWAVVKEVGLEAERIALLLAEEQGTLDQTALKNHRTKRSLLYGKLSQIEANTLHRKTVIDGIDQLLALLSNK